MENSAERQQADFLRAVRYIAGHRPLLTAAIIVLSAATALLSGVGVGFIVPIVDLARASTQPSQAGGLTGLFARIYVFVGVPLTLETAVGGVALVMTTRYSASFLSRYLRAHLQASYVRTLRERAFDAAIGARIAYFDDHGSDEALNAIVTQTYYAGEFIKNGTRLFETVLVALVYIVLAVVLAPSLALLTAVFFVALALVIRFVFGSGYDAGDRVARANEAIQDTVQSGIQGIRTVKLFGLGREFRERATDAFRSHESAGIVLARNRAAFSQLNKLASALTVFGLLYLGIAVFAVPLAQLAAFLFAMFRLAPRVTSINDIFYRAEGDLPHVVRMIEFIDALERNEEPGPEETEREPVPERITEITFEDVEFGYADDGTVLDGVSFRLEYPGFVALVGESGAGKSTVVSLLARLYDPDAGRITANGIPIDRFDRREWRERVAVVRQQPHIFDDTLRYNLTVGNRGASPDAVEHACQVARVTEFLDELPDGYDTELGDDGVKLSGGQRQRVAIARALLKDADVLVLDEATSDLDTGLEAAVHGAIEEMDRDFMTIAIAHRLSTVIGADRIHVFEDGNIVETGTHAELLDRDGTYASLYAKQARA